MRDRSQHHGAPKPAALAFLQHGKLPDVQRALGARRTKEAERSILLVDRHQGQAGAQEVGMSLRGLDIVVGNPGQVGDGPK
ncbi:hypothetical protein D9M70_566700 [compost metagenome]